MSASGSVKYCGEKKKNNKNELNSTNDNHQLVTSVRCLRYCGYNSIIILYLNYREPTVLWMNVF